MMGMYTGLRGSITFKNEYKENIRKLGAYIGDTRGTWSSLGLPETPEIKEFVNKSRAMFIPFGMVCYMPECWGDQYFDYCDKENSINFTCSLKNYEGEINAFIKMLPQIATSWELEELYEEDSSPTTHSA